MEQSGQQRGGSKFGQLFQEQTANDVEQHKSAMGLHLTNQLVAEPVPTG